MNVKERYEAWLDDEAILPEYRQELNELTDEKDIEDRFYRDLEFGTAGLRGVLGAGTNRMNEHTVGKATLGLARYLKDRHGSARIAIAYDSRIKSPEFAKISALILAQAGHEAYLFESLRPVPLLSFAVRHLQADAGIVITASHNPSEYNGYKVYSGYGGQVTDQEAKDILKEINAIESFGEIRAMAEERALAEGKLHYIGKEVDDAYYAAINDLSIRKDLIKDRAGDLAIIYTPLHGSGKEPVERILGMQGYSDLRLVADQAEPDGTFPTAPYPNPEDPKVFDLALAMHEKEPADVIFGTDPDADRLGVIVQDNQGKTQVLTGNQTGMLLTEYILKSLKEEDKLPDNAVIIKTIVTTESVANICQDYGVELMDVLTGFKYIGEKIEEFKETGSHSFLFGFEESFGYSLGTLTRDKDAVVTAMMVCEMALYYKSKGMTLYDALQEVYEKYGYFKEGLMAYKREGQAGAQEIKSSMEYFRQLALKEAMGIAVVKKQDFLTSEETSADGSLKELALPKSNVVKYFLADDSWFCLRPSGTEPKMKAYTAIKAASAQEADAKLAAFNDFVDGLVKSSFR